MHLLVASASEVGFRWDLLALAWSRPGLPLLSNLTGPVQHFKAAILDAWRDQVAADLCDREGFRWSASLRCRLLAAALFCEGQGLAQECRGGWCMEWFLVGAGPRRVCSMPVLFHDLMRRDKGHWPRCLL